MWTRQAPRSLITLLRSLEPPTQGPLSCYIGIILDVSLFGCFWSALIHVSLCAPKSATIFSANQAISVAPRLSSWIVAPGLAVLCTRHKAGKTFKRLWGSMTGNKHRHFYSESPTKILFGMNAKRATKIDTVDHFCLCHMFAQLERPACPCVASVVYSVHESIILTYMYVQYECLYICH